MSDEKRIIVFGPGPLFKGGIANYTVSLAKALNEFPEVKVHVVSWTQQYPAIIPRDFYDRSSKKDPLEGTGIDVKYITNYNNPFSWAETYRYIRDWKPDIVIYQWAITVQGLPIGFISKNLSQHKNIEQAFVMHNVKQKESSSIDKIGLRYGLKNGNTFIVLSYANAEELKQMFPEFHFTINETGERAIDGSRTIIKLFHPVYDMFRPDPDFDIEKKKQELNLQKHVFLFFGFIRKYKGLHNCIKAFAKVAEKRDDVSLLIVGESFWQTLDSKKLSTRLKKNIFGIAKSLLLKKADDDENYRPLDLIKELNLENKVTIVNHFVPNEEVHEYFQVADALLNFYNTSAPSGVESIAFNFSLPVLATRVGHFPETIQPGYNGYLAEPENVDSMAEQMLKFLERPIARENVAKTAEKYSWKNYAKAVLKS